MGSRNVFSGSGINVVSTKQAMQDSPHLSSQLVAEKIVKPTIITRGDKLSAVKAGLVPEAYIDCEFDTDRIRENQTLQCNASKRKFTVRKFDDYKGVTTGIVSTLIAGKLPTQSYLIGAPNGFGKTSFVNTCIMKLHAQGRQCAPYISLFDLAQVREATERRLLNGISSKEKYKYDSSVYATNHEQYMNSFYDKIDEQTYEKKPINLIDRFSWSEYMNCAVLFCYFTDLVSKVIESEVLKTVITIRGTKGLPTVAMISTSLNPYKNDKYLGEYVWNEILDYNGTHSSYDRLTHVSCYKDYNVPLEQIARE